MVLCGKRGRDALQDYLGLEPQNMSPLFERGDGAVRRKRASVDVCVTEEMVLCGKRGQEALQDYLGAEPQDERPALLTQHAGARGMCLWVRGRCVDKQGEGREVLQDCLGAEPLLRRRCTPAILLSVHASLTALNPHSNRNPPLPTHSFAAICPYIDIPSFPLPPAQTTHIDDGITLSATLPRRCT
eukprot:363737-Chlamydomonas_euryale.AAC.10